MSNKDPRYIVIEGPIGVGKTTLAHKMSQDLGYELILEAADENPFLANFYRNPTRNALSTQVFFLLQRVKQLEPFGGESMFPGQYIGDFMMERDFLFASINLDPQEMELYRSLYTQLARNMPKPSVVVYLQAPPTELMNRIRKRNIDYEQGISGQYLEQVHDAYGKFFMSYDDAPLMVVNTATIDLLNNDKAYERFLELLFEAKSGRYFYNESLF